MLKTLREVLLKCVVGCCAVALGAVACSGGGGDDAPRGPAIRVALGAAYTPGVIPAGIGEPVEEAAHLTDEWSALKPGRRVKHVQIVNTGGGEGEWLKTQLLAGTAPEILSQNAEVAWMAVGKDWYVPLDEYLERPNPYIPGNTRWADSFLNQELLWSKRAPDGRLYCITIDIVETGIFYNKTILAEHGIDGPPETWAEMIRDFETLRAGGVHTPMATAGGGLGSDWGQDIVMEMLYHDLIPEMDLIASKGDTGDYIKHYWDPPEAGFLTTKGFFSRRDPRWREVNRLIYQWRTYWPAELKNSDAMRLFLTGRVAYFWDGSWSIRRMVTDPYLNGPDGFEWGVTYLPTITKETSRFATGSPATVIGGAATQLHVTNSAVKNGTLEECIDLLMFLSSPQAVERMASESLLFIPNIKGAEVDPRLNDFQEIFQRKPCVIQFLEAMDGIYKKEWRRWLDHHLAVPEGDGIDLDDLLARVERNFADWVESHEGEPTWDFTEMEEVWKTREARLLRELEPTVP